MAESCAKDHGNVRSDCHQLFSQSITRHLRHGHVRDHKVKLVRAIAEGFQGFKGEEDGQVSTFNRVVKS